MRAVLLTFIITIKLIQISISQSIFAPCDSQYNCGLCDQACSDGMTNCMGNSTSSATIFGCMSDAYNNASLGCQCVFDTLLCCFNDDPNWGGITDFDDSCLAGNCTNDIYAECFLDDDCKHPLSVVMTGTIMSFEDFYQDYCIDNATTSQYCNDDWDNLYFECFTGTCDFMGGGGGDDCGFDSCFDEIMACYNDTLCGADLDAFNNNDSCTLDIEKIEFCDLNTTDCGILFEDTFDCYFSNCIEPYCVSTTTTDEPIIITTDEPIIITTNEPITTLQPTSITNSPSNYPTSSPIICDEQCDLSCQYNNTNHTECLTSIYICYTTQKVNFTSFEIDFDVDLYFECIRGALNNDTIDCSCQYDVLQCPYEYCWYPDASDEYIECSSGCTQNMLDCILDDQCYYSWSDFIEEFFDDDNTTDSTDIFSPTTMNQWVIDYCNNTETGINCDDTFNDLWDCISPCFYEECIFDECLTQYDLCIADSLCNDDLTYITNQDFDDCVLQDEKTTYCEENNTRCDTLFENVFTCYVGNCLECTNNDISTTVATPQITTTVATPEMTTTSEPSSAPTPSPSDAVPQGTTVVDSANNIGIEKTIVICLALTFYMFT